MKSFACFVTGAASRKRRCDGRPIHGEDWPTVPRTEPEAPVNRSNPERNAHTGHPPWMHIALAELGIRRPARQQQPAHRRIQRPHESGRLRRQDFVVLVVRQLVHRACGHPRHRVGARAFVARLGRPLEQPVYGCIAVLTRDDPAAWKGHVGFYLRHDHTHVHLFGGNQLDEARELAYPVSEVIGYRWPDVG
jgi:uncharacterized protein (TIGR02594 family)